MSIKNLKPLAPEAIPAAIDKATRYRLLNEPAEAESICLDVLRAGPDNQEALIILLLARTDQFGRGFGVSETRPEDVLPRLQREYDRLYYAGIICERRGKVHLQQNTPGSTFAAYDCFFDAMGFYEKAEAIRPAGNDDAILRWNTCARIVTQNKLTARPREEYVPALE